MRKDNIFMKREDSELHREALRQGQEYSRKMVEEYDTLWGQPFWDYVRKSRAAWMAARLARAGAHGLRALDAGCGIGFTAFEAAASGLFSEIVALDMSGEALAIGEKLRAEQRRTQAAEIIKFVQGDFFMLQADAPFDVVYMHEVFEHIPSAEAVFAKARDLLAPGGFLMISTPNRDRLFNRLRVAAGRQRLLIDPFHVREYSFSEMAAARTGWRLEAATGRQLFDINCVAAPFAVAGNAARNFMEKALRVAAENRVVYRAGALCPGVSAEILVLFRKRADRG